MTKNIFNYQQNSNNSMMYSSYISSSYPFTANISTINQIKPKKRNYNEFINAYKQYHNEAFNSEAEGLNKSFNLKIRKNLSNIQNSFFNNEGINIIKNTKKNNLNDFPQIHYHKKVIMNLDTKKKFINEEDDIDLIEKDFNISDKKYCLSKSYLFDEDSKFYSDLDDTKENSFSCLNFSVDYPEINLDINIKDKLISNAIELEKTFNRIFNVKNIPNKK